VIGKARSNRIATRRAAHVALLAAVIAIGLAGCTVGGFIAANVLPETIDALYEPTNRKTVIVVDDPDKLLPSVPLMGVTAARVEATLKEQEVITEFVPSNQVDALRFANAEFETWPIDRIGREVGAEQVIYIRIERFAIITTPDTTQPTATYRVRVVESKTGQRLFPVDTKAGVRKTTQMNFRSVRGATRGNLSLLERRLADRLGLDAAKMFYDHEPPQVGGEKFED